MAFNARNLEAAIEQLSEFKEIPIEVRMEPIRTKRGSAKKTSKANDKIAAFVRAAHVWTSWEKSAACRKALSDLYSSRNKEGFPLGIQARFVPYTLDSRFITTPKTAQNVERMKSKQKRFNDRTSTARNFTIIGLDYQCPDLGMMLREVIMGLRLSSQPKWNLFMAVDQMSNYSSMILAFHEDLKQEATMVIPTLVLIIIEAKPVWSECMEFDADFQEEFNQTMNDPKVLEADMGFTDVFNDRTARGETSASAVPECMRGSLPIGIAENMFPQVDYDGNQHVCPSDRGSSNGWIGS